MEDDATKEMRKNGLSIFIDCEEQIALWVEGYARNVSAVREGQCVRGIAIVCQPGKK